MGKKVEMKFGRPLIRKTPNSLQLAKTILCAFFINMSTIELVPKATQQVLLGEYIFKSIELETEELVIENYILP